MLGFVWDLLFGGPQWSRWGAQFVNWFVGIVTGWGLMLAHLFAAVAMATARFLVAITSFVVRTTSNLALRVGTSAIRDDHPIWWAIINRRIDWKRALRSMADFEAEMEDLEADLGEDGDNNGIPDAYDEVVHVPADDILGIKFPVRPLIENDYVQFLPRSKTDTPLANILPGRKGIVRSEEYTLGGVGGGQHVVVKWNAGHIFTRVNALDLHLLGHVHNALR